MTTITFDTLKYVDDLVASGMPETQAKALAKAQLTINETNSEELTTKADISLLKKDIDVKFEKELAPIRADLLLIKWMLALIIITTVVPVIKSLFS